MKIREYRAEDSAGAKDLILSILEKEYPFDRSAFEEDSDVNDITGTYSGKGNGFFVIPEGDKIVGLIGIKRDLEKVALIRRLFVEEKYRKQGLGIKLLEKAMEFCRANNYDEITFRATDKMQPAINLCKKMGFEETEDLEVSGFHIHKFVLKL